jgi:CDP-glucose 4,6-dehydratase
MERTPERNEWSAAYRGERVLVTGATGLIGSWLVRALLARGAETHTFVFSRPEPDSELVRSGDLERTIAHRGRLEDASSVRRAVAEARPEVVFHLGAQPLVGVAREDPVLTFEANVAGTWTLLEACRCAERPPRAVVVASSDKAYGASERLPYRETDPVAGVEEPYEASKAMADVLARTYAATYALPTRLARCGNVYGGGDWNWSRLVPGTIRALLRGERPVIRSDGTPIRDYVHVDDVVDAYLRLGAADLRPGDAFNVSSGERRSVLEVVGLLQRALGTELEPDIRAEAKGEIQQQWLDSAKARSTLGWRPRRTFAESLPGVVGWYRELLS